MNYFVDESVHVAAIIIIATLDFSPLLKHYLGPKNERQRTENADNGVHLACSILLSLLHFFLLSKLSSLGFSRIEGLDIRRGLDIDVRNFKEAFWLGDLKI